MNSLIKLALFSTLILSHFFLLAQNKLLEMKSGGYLSTAEILSNSPSILITSESINSTDAPNYSICSEESGYIESIKSLEKYRAKDLLAISINHKTFINYSKSYSDESIKEYKNICFYKLYTINAISSFFIQYKKEKMKSAYDAPEYNPYGYQGQRVKLTSYELQEYVYIFDIGKSFMLKDDADKVIAYIKQDNFFKKSSIRRKNLKDYILQYNKRHPIELPN